MNIKVLDIAFTLDHLLNIARLEISEEEASQKAVDIMGESGNKALAAAGLAEYKKWHRSIESQEESKHE